MNKINLNVKKTQYVIFRPKNKPLPHNVKLSINNNIITPVNSCRFLGVVFRFDLSWSEHINHVRAKLSRSLGMLYRLKYLLPLRVRKQLYFAFIHSHLTYCHLVWGTCNKTDAERVSSLQKRSLKMISSHPPPLTDSLYKTLNVPPFSELYQLSLATMIFREFKHDRTMFSNKYLNRQVAYDLRTISLTGSRPRTNYGTKTIDYQIISLLNAYPSLIELANQNSSMSRFKKQVKLLFLPP